MTVVPNRADLRVALTGPTSARSGATVTYRATVTNAGPVAASSVRTVVAVSGATTTGTTPATGSGSIRVGSTTLTGALWTAATLAPGASTTYELTARVTARRGQHLTAAAGTVATTPDPTGGNNLAAASVRVS